MAGNAVPHEEDPAHTEPLGVRGTSGAGPSGPRTDRAPAAPADGLLACDAVVAGPDGARHAVTTSDASGVTSGTSGLGRAKAAAATPVAAADLFGSEADCWGRGSGCPTGVLTIGGGGAACASICTASPIAAAGGSGDWT